MSKPLEEQIAQLKSVVLHMASLSERMLHRSIQAMVLRDITEAIELSDMESQVNQMQLEIDERCQKILALQAPMAHDLRLIIASMKTGNDLERIADQSINIKESAAILTNLPGRPPIPDLLRMADLTQKMVRESIEALEQENTTLARMIVLRDDEVDAMKDLIFRQLMRQMMADPHKIQDSLQIILVSRHLERIADHATNIAENVVYMVESRDIRHHAEENEVSR